MKKTILWSLFGGFFVALSSIFALARFPDYFGTNSYIYWPIIFSTISSLMYIFSVYDKGTGYAGKFKNIIVYIIVKLVTAFVLYYGISVYLISKLS